LSGGELLRLCSGWYMGRRAAPAHWHRLLSGALYTS
jgi:hypothetical protein